MLMHIYFEYEVQSVVGFIRQTIPPGYTPTRKDLATVLSLLSFNFL